MKRFSLFFLLAIVVSGPACSQAVSSDDSADRKARILENLVFEFPQIEQYSVEITTIEPSGIPGLDQGEFVVNGQQTQKFLVTEDDEKFYMVASDAIDVSRTTDEIAQARADRETEAEAEIVERKEALNALIEGMPVRGNPDADVTIVEFSDFQCPYCARAAGTVERVLEEHGDDVRLVYFQYPLGNHPWARPASIAALCAAQQDKEAFWTLHDGYFQNQRALNTENVIARSREFLAGSGVDMEAWASCAEDTSSEAHQEAVSTIERDIALGQEYGVSGTPGFFVNGRHLNGAQPFEAFDAIIQEAKAEID